MSKDYQTLDIDLLSLCAILGWFDHELLHTLTGRGHDEIAALLTSERNVASMDMSGIYRLEESLASSLRARLLVERPLDELTIHLRAFEYFLHRMEHPDSIAQRLSAEDRCFHHLGEIRLLLTEQRDWHTLANYVAAALAAGPQRAQHLHELTFYQGFVLIRTQQYDHGEAILTTLLSQTDLEDALRVRVFNALGQVHWYQTHYDLALNFYQQVERLAETIGDLLYQGFGLLNMSQVYNELGYYEQSFELSVRSLQVFRDLQDRAREAQALYTVGNNAMYLGRWSIAQSYFQEAIQLHEALSITAGLANLYGLQGFLYLLLGDDIQSEAYYLRSLEIAQSSEHGDMAIAMDIWLYLGFLYQTQHRWGEALSTFEQAISAATQVRNQHGLSLIHYRRGNVFERQGHLDDAYAAYAQAIDSIEALGGATESEEIKIGLLGTTQQLYEAIVLLLLDLSRPAEAFHYVERARSRAFLDSLAKKAPELSAALDRSVATLADVQAQLPADAVLLEYYTTGVLPRGEHLLNSIPETNARLREYLTLPPNIILFAITRDRFDVYRPALNPNSLRPPIGDHYPGRHLLHGRLPQHLYDRLIAPAAALLDGCSVLYLVPHGPLHYVPFTALRSAAGQYLLHAGGPALAHAPSATILLRNCLGRPRERGSALLALGFNDPQGEQPLRYAEAEAQHIARMVGGDAWTGMEPKSQRLIAAGRDIRWLHIAGHARFDPHDPLGSALYLGPDDALSARAIIRDLDLAADLVTLSSCTSGVSHVVPGDELLGLQRALLYAGAPTVVCTRWEARDLVALLVMDRFYTALQRGQPPAVALRDAQIAVRDLTGRELTTLLDRWRAEATDLAAALGAPADALHDVQVSTRELGDIDLNVILNSWRAEAADLATAMEQPAATPPNMPDARPFADPLLWAPFMLVGRA